MYYISVLSHALDAGHAADWLSRERTSVKCSYGLLDNLSYLSYCHHHLRLTRLHTMAVNPTIAILSSTKLPTNLKHNLRTYCLAPGRIGDNLRPSSTSRDLKNWHLKIWWLNGHRTSSCLHTTHFHASCNWPNHPTLEKTANEGVPPAMADLARIIYTINIE